MLQGTLIAASASLVLASAASDHDRDPYLIQRGSAFAQGCFPPCLCPLLYSANVSGSFSLIEDGSNPLFMSFLVDDFDVTVDFYDSTKHIVGIGSYVYGGEVAYLQRMELDLSIDGEAPVHLDSGWVPFTQWPPVVDLSVSMNGMFCFDIALWIVASPPPNPHDLDGDGEVDGADLAILLGAWGPCTSEPCATADFNSDGTVDAADLSLLLGAWTG